MREREHFAAAVQQAYDAKLIGKNNVHGWDFDIVIHHGAGALYLRRGNGADGVAGGQERPAAAAPPFPANVGVYGNPTTINNAEIHRRGAEILRRGGAWFSELGRPNNAGTKLFCVSGHVNQPAVFEEEMGVPFEEMIERHCGGVRGGWDNLLAVIPGGGSMPVVPAEKIREARMDYDGVREVGSSLGNAAVIVMDKSTDIIRAIWRLSAFYKHEAAASARRAVRAPAGSSGCWGGWSKAGRRSARSTCCSR